MLSLKSRIARLCELKAGDTVGYGRAWTAEDDARIALVMCGYADGLRRGLSGKADVLVRGQRAPIAGRIAMDMCMVDVTGVPGVAPDDEVVIIGRQGDERIDADELGIEGRDDLVGDPRRDQCASAQARICATAPSSAQRP